MFYNFGNRISMFVLFMCQCHIIVTVLGPYVFCVDVAQYVFVDASGLEIHIAYLDDSKRSPHRNGVGLHAASKWCFRFLIVIPCS